MKKRVDDIGFGGLKLVQDEDAFCYGTDAVLLANMACTELQITEEMRICDLGTNTAVIPLIMSARCKAKEIVGVEVQKQAFELAKENLVLNSLTDRLKLVLANVKDIKGMDSGLLGAASFDAVTTNPPYMESGRGLVSGNTAKAIARHELLAGLEDFFEAAAFLLNEGGSLFMVHRPARLIDICEESRRFALEPKAIQLVSGKPGGVPNILLMHFVKGGKRQLKWLENISVRNEDGSFTKEVLEAYEI